MGNVNIRILPLRATIPRLSESSISLNVSCIYKESRSKARPPSPELEDLKLVAGVKLQHMEVFSLGKYLLDPGYTMLI